MSHIQGHIETEASSCGILLVDDTDVKLYFIPPVFKIKEGEPIGFHPIMIGDSVLAVDVVRWDDHLEAEEIARKVIGRFDAGKSAQDNIEALFDQKEKTEWLRDEFKSAMFKQKHKAVITKTLDYFESHDFMNFYVDNGVASADFAKEKIIKIYQKQVMLKHPVKTHFPFSLSEQTL